MQYIRYRTQQYIHKHIRRACNNNKVLLYMLDKIDGELSVCELSCEFWADLMIWFHIIPFMCSVDIILFDCVDMLYIFSNICFDLRRFQNSLQKNG